MNKLFILFLLLILSCGDKPTEEKKKTKLPPFDLFDTSKGN